MNRKNKFIEIIRHYGLPHQLKKLNEEVYELYEAIWEDDLEHIHEEFADVCVLLQEIRLYCGLDFKKIEKIMFQKVDRQLERISHQR